MRRVISAAALVWLASPVAQVAAFSESTLFADPALMGGGEGRYFTGSRQDPYSCSVCHEGGKPPVIDIAGLPERLVPGKTHDVVIRWDASKASHSLNLELAASSGEHAGLELGALDELSKRSRCEGSDDGDPAVFSVDIGKRRILGVSDCGASELRFSFTTPDVSALYFSVGVVRSDGSGTSQGDGVYELRRRIGRDPVAADAGCSVAPGRGTGSAAWSLYLASLLWFVCRRRSRRRWLLTPLIAMSCAGCFEPQTPVEGRTTRTAEDAGFPYLDTFEDLLGGSQKRGGGSVACGPDPSPLSQLRVSVRTVSGSGRYRPRNVGAFWIEDAEGAWVATLEQWGKRRAKWLTAFNEASGGDVVDAITGPTLQAHKLHELTWDLKDSNGCEVPNGSYQLRMELTDWSGTGQNFAVPFEIERDSVELMPPDQPTFRELQIRTE